MATFAERGVFRHMTSGGLSDVRDCASSNAAFADICPQRITQLGAHLDPMAGYGGFGGWGRLALAGGTVAAPHALRKTKLCRYHAQVWRPEKGQEHKRGGVCDF